MFIIPKLVCHAKYKEMSYKLTMCKPSKCQLLMCHNIHVQYAGSPPFYNLTDGPFIENVAVLVGSTELLFQT